MRALRVLAALCLLSCDDIEDPAPPPPDPMSVACDTIAHDLCDALAGCCQIAGERADSCFTGARARCEPFADDVRKGRAHYDETAARACAEEEKHVFGNCELTVLSYTLASSADLLSCERIFTTGTAAPGDPCHLDDDCAPISRTGTLTYCDTDDDLCEIIDILGAGAPCTGKEGGQVVELCGQDLTCQRAPGQTIGACAPKTPVGGRCAGDSLVPCVSEAFCDAEMQQCARRKNGGEPCSTPVECRSLSCDHGVCAFATSFFDANVCGGLDRLIIGTQSMIPRAVPPRSHSGRVSKAQARARRNRLFSVEDRKTILVPRLQLALSDN